MNEKRARPPHPDLTNPPGSQVFIHFQALLSVTIRVISGGLRGMARNTGMNIRHESEPEIPYE